MKFYLKIVSISLALGLSACAGGQNSSPQYDASYVSPTQYQSYNCKQIRAEMKRVSSKIEQSRQIDGSNQILGAAVTVFAISQGYAVGGNNEDNSQQKRYRNQYDILEETAIQKQCNL